MRLSPRALAFVWPVLLVLLAQGGCKRQLTPEEDLAAAIAYVNTHATPEERDSCPGDAMPSREWDTKNFKTYCDQRLSWCAEACNLIDATACYALAVVLQQSERDPAAVEVLFYRGCALGITSACTNRAAGMVSVESASAATWACATRTFEKTCARGDPWGCVMYAGERVTGVHLERDHDKAREALSKACLHGEVDPACKASLQMKAMLDAPPK